MTAAQRQAERAALDLLVPRLARLLLDGFRPEWVARVLVAHEREWFAERAA